MKAVILAGGYGTRISEETLIKPKPMIEIGGKPILWHIMKLYSFYGINEFIICAGYKAYIIKEYFANYFLHSSDTTFNLKDNSIEIHEKFAEPWKVTVIDTGEDTMTGGRLKRVEKYLKGGGTFCMTYGDGLSNIDIRKLIDFHKEKKVKATLTAIQPKGRFGALRMESNLVTKFEEKPEGDGAWINGGYFVLEEDVFDYIDNDETVWERHPLQNLSTDKELSAYKHNGFWQPMDTLREKIELENLWKNGKAQWKVWS